jgi:hypothetical protein
VRQAPYDQDRRELPRSRQSKLEVCPALSDDGTPPPAETVAEIARNHSAGWYCIDLGGAWVLH